MALHDDDIRAIINAEIGEEGMTQLLAMFGTESSGDSVDDLKIMASNMGVEAEDLLYALFVDEPLFDDDTWRNLTTGDGS